VKKWIISVIVFLGVGAGLGNLGNLDSDTLPVVGQIITMAAVGLLGIIKLYTKEAKDEDQNGVPDSIQGTWLGKALKYAVPILMTIAGAAGVTVLSGCSANPQWLGVSLEDTYVQPEGDPAEWEPGDPLDIGGMITSGFSLWGQEVFVSTQFTEESIGACLEGTDIARICWKQDREGPSFDFRLGPEFPIKGGGAHTTGGSSGAGEDRVRLDGTEVRDLDYCSGSDLSDFGYAVHCRYKLGIWFHSRYGGRVEGIRSRVRRTYSRDRSAVQSKRGENRGWASGYRRAAGPYRNVVRQA